MRLVSARVRYIYKKFYYNKASDRNNSLCQYSAKFLESLSIFDKVNVGIDVIKISALIDSYFLDVIRFKEYHFNPKNLNSNIESLVLSEEWLHEVHSIKLISLNKVAALTTKWILKYSPIFIYPKDGIELSEDERKIICSATAMLALNFSLILMGVEPHNVEPSEYKDLTYHFQYRDFDERSAMIYFGMILNKYGDSIQVKPCSYPLNTESNVDNPIGDKLNMGANTIKQNRRYDDKHYSVFIACAEDCQSLRKAAVEVIESINKGISAVKSKLVYFDWKSDKVAGYTKNYQEDVYKDAQRKWEKSECDILILSLWYKYGKFTIEEYEYFIEQAKVGSTPRLLCCHYNGRIEPNDVNNANTDKLFKWINKKNSSWAEISPPRDSIKTVRKYKEVLRSQLDKYLDEYAD